MKIVAVIPAAGAGTRLGGKVPKQFLKLAGVEVLFRTLSAFNLPEIEKIAVAVPEEYMAAAAGYESQKPLHIIPGRPTRAESVFAALQTLSPHTEIVLIHDGSRPFVTPELITAVARAAAAHGAAVACAPVTDTIKQTDAYGKILATPDRATLWHAQTPQGFTYKLIRRAYAEAKAAGVLAAATDDASLVERLGIPVHIVQSTHENIKITTKTDMLLAEAMLSSRGFASHPTNFFEKKFDKKL